MFNINIFSVKFSFNKNVVILLGCGVFKFCVIKIELN